MAVRIGDYLVLRDLGGLRRALRVNDIAELRDADETAVETAIVTRRGEAVVIKDDFDEILPLIVQPGYRR